jgi:hypothetical protein
MRNKHNVSITALLALMVSFLGCGGGSSSPPSQNPPAISNLSYAPNQATQGSGGGTVMVSATLDAVDLDGNMSTVTFTSYDSLGNVIHTSADQIPFFSDRSISGSIATAASMDTTVKGTYTFKIYITDSTGLRSNVVTGTLSVI